MPVTRCSNNHFYDSGKYASCPHCGAFPHSDSGATVALTQPFQDNVEAQVTVAVTQPIYDFVESNVTIPVTQPLSLPPVEPPVQPMRKPVDDDVKTVAMFANKTPVEPVVGWLVSIEGSGCGASFRLKSGRNFIGRSSQMDVCLEGDNTVSRDRHAIVVFEPKALIYLVSPGEAKELAYLNDEVVLTPRKLSVNDVITVGATKLMFFPCCDENLNWSNIVENK